MKQLIVSLRAAQAVNADDEVFDTFPGFQGYFKGWKTPPLEIASVISLRRQRFTVVVTLNCWMGLCTLIIEYVIQEYVHIILFEVIT
jgi:hypothetical protein